MAGRKSKGVPSKGVRQTENKAQTHSELLYSLEDSVVFAQAMFEYREKQVGLYSETLILRVLMVINRKQTWAQFHLGNPGKVMQLCLAPLKCNHAFLGVGHLLEHDQPLLDSSIWSCRGYWKIQKELQGEVRAENDWNTIYALYNSPRNGNITLKMQS